MFPLKDNIPTDRLPILTLLLIAANVFVYFFVQGGGITHGPREAEVVKYGAIPYEITHPGERCGTSATVPAGGSAELGSSALELQTDGGLLCEGQRTSVGPVTDVQPTGPSAWVTLITSMFLHGGLFHLLGNMLFLWIFGTNVEDSMSRLRFVGFYLLAGLMAIGLQIVMEPSSTVPTVGASGAIAGVLGGYILLYPRARVVTLVFIVFFVTLVELPAWVLLGVWFALQAISAAGSIAEPIGGGGGVAYFAHVGGFVFGLLTIRFFAQRRKQQPRSAGWAGALP